LFERNADQIERRWGDEALDGGAVQADNDRDTQILGPSGG
jgi:hypothetical protein